MPYRGTYGLTHVSVAGRRRGPPASGWVGGEEYRRVNSKGVEPSVDPSNFAALSLGWEGYSKALVSYL